MGNVNPLTEKSVPVTLAWDIVTADPPVFVIVSDLSPGFCAGMVMRGSCSFSPVSASSNAIVVSS